MLTDQQRIYNKEWRARNKEKMALKAREYYHQNANKRAAYNVQWLKDHPEQALNTRLMRDYGITLEAFNAMMEQQNEQCAICKTALQSSGNMKNTNIDHCHKDGHVRGILCGSCNRALGLFQDDVDVLQSAINYLSHGWGSNPHSLPSEDSAVPFQLP